MSIVTDEQVTAAISNFYWIKIGDVDRDDPVWGDMRRTLEAYEAARGESDGDCIARAIVEWMDARGILPDTEEDGSIDMREVIEALDNHEHELLAAKPAAQGDALVDSDKERAAFASWHVEFCSRYPELASRHGFGDDRKALAAWMARAAKPAVQGEAVDYQFKPRDQPDVYWTRCSKEQFDEINSRVSKGGFETRKLYDHPVAAGVTAWQPIETAPKDGTVVLVLLEGSDVPQSALFRDRVGWTIVWDGYRIKPHYGPICWMPCPGVSSAPQPPTVEPLPQSSAPPALYLHDDGRYALALGDEARQHLTRGEPGWHRVPLDVVFGAAPQSPAVDADLRRDAERYRYMRAHARDSHMWSDESIDAAIAEGEESTR